MGTGRRQETEAIELPPPEMAGGMPLMQAVSNRLWAASGVNRPDTGQRTAPSAHD